MSNHKYVVKVDDKVVWEGLALPDNIRKIIKKHTNKKISVAWVPTKEDILIV